MDFEHLPNDCSPPKIVSKMSSSFISQKIKRMMNAKMDDESVSNDDSPFPLNSTENFSGGQEKVFPNRFSGEKKIEEFFLRKRPSQIFGANHNLSTS
jgi:hypothetical protein